MKVLGFGLVGFSTLAAVANAYWYAASGGQPVWLIGVGAMVVCAMLNAYWLGRTWLL